MAVITDAEIRELHHNRPPAHSCEHCQEPEVIAKIRQLLHAELMPRGQAPSYYQGCLDMLMMFVSTLQNPYCTPGGLLTVSCGLADQAVEHYIGVGRRRKGAVRPCFRRF